MPWKGPDGSGNRGGRKPGAVKLPDVLRDLRSIYRGTVPLKADATADTPGLLALKQLYIDDPNAFMTQLRAAENQHHAASQKAREAAKAEVPRDADPGTDECVRLIDEILAKALAESKP